MSVLCDRGACHTPQASPSIPVTLATSLPKYPTGLVRVQHRDLHKFGMKRKKVERFRIQKTFVDKGYIHTVRWSDGHADSGTPTPTLCYGLEEEGGINKNGPHGPLGSGRHCVCAGNGKSNK